MTDETLIEIELRRACREAQKACDAYSAACAAAGLKSRWDFDPKRQMLPAVNAARNAHIAAGERMQRLFEAHRQEQKGVRFAAPRREIVRQCCAAALQWYRVFGDLSGSREWLDKARMWRDHYTREIEANNAWVRQNPDEAARLKLMESRPFPE